MVATHISIGSQRQVGPGQPSLVIAEIGQNHNGDVRLAEQLVDAAAWAGADAVKLVKRDLEQELCGEARDRRYDSPHSFGATYGEHRRALELPPEVHEALADRARRHGLLFISTPCDIPSAQLVDSLDVDAVKVASRDTGNLPLLGFVASLGRPVILSTGMSGLAEIDAAADLLRRRETRWLLMQCTSLYPTPAKEVHLRSLATLAERYGVPVGYSDHTLGILMAPVAAALGAAVIEKHFTLDRTLKGSDHAGSAEPQELRQMIEHIRAIEAALGRDDKPLPAEVNAVRVRIGRSLVTRVPLTAGALLDEGMLTLKCPGDGLTWLDRPLVLGRRLKRDIAADEKLSIEDFE